MEQYFTENFAKFLADEGALKFGNFTLKDGRPTPYFVNMGAFKTASQISSLGSFYARMLIDEELAHNIDVIFGPSYKGSMIAIAAALALERHDITFNPAVEYDRKEVKTHGDASSGAKRFVTDAFYDGAKTFIVDDVGTSMATKYEALEKIAAEAADKGWEIPILGVGIGIDREQTTGEKGEDAISVFTERTGIPVISVAGISDVVEYLFEREHLVLIGGEKKPISDALKAEFDEYMKIYGVKR